MFVVIFCLLFLLPVLTQADTVSARNSYPLWKGIEAGSFNVGFRTIDWKDKTRSLADGAEDGFFPVQIAVWYPANERWTCDNAMPFKEYFYLTEQKNDFREPSPERRAKALDIFYNFAKYGLSDELNEARLKETGGTCTAATRDGKLFAREFPVILAGHDGGLWKGATLNEYLASHGYVVVSTGLLSATSAMLSREPQKALARRVQTFEITEGLLDEIGFARRSEIGLLGINADGMSVLLYQMKNQTARAVVSIDGWEGKNNGFRFVSENEHFDPAAFDVPYLEFQQDEKTDREPLQLNTSVFDNLTKADRFSFVVKDFGHAFLTGNLIAVPELDERTVRQHEFWYETVRTFFDAYVRGDPTAAGTIRRADKRHDPSFFARAEHKKGNMIEIHR